MPVVDIVQAWRSLFEMDLFCMVFVYVCVCSDFTMKTVRLSYAMFCQWIISQISVCDNKSTKTKSLCLFVSIRTSEIERISSHNRLVVYGEEQEPHTHRDTQTRFNMKCMIYMLIIRTKTKQNTNLNLKKKQWRKQQMGTSCSLYPSVDISNAFDWHDCHVSFDRMSFDSALFVLLIANIRTHIHNILWFHLLCLGFSVLCDR